MVLVLSDDKSAYSTLKGLVEHLRSDAKDADHAMTTYGERTRDYARAEGARGAYNLTIALITSTDVWRQGKRDEETRKEAPHWHVTGPTEEYLASAECQTTGRWLVESA